MRWTRRARTQGRQYRWMSQIKVLDLGGGEGKLPQLQMPASVQEEKRKIQIFSCHQLLRPLVERQELRSRQPQAPQESQPGEPNNSDVGTNLAVIFENYYLNTSLKSFTM